MATQRAIRRWTYDEFARLPDDGNRYEVVSGDLYMTPSPRPIHQRIVTRLSTLLDQFAVQHDLGCVLAGPVDVLFAEGDYLTPDVVFVRREREGIISDRGVEAAPDLVVEVLSRSTADRDRGVKRQRYAWFGVPEYWVVDADARQVEVFRMLDDPTRPRIVRDLLTWTPAPGGPTLEVALQDVLRGFGPAPVSPPPLADDAP